MILISLLLYIGLSIYILLKLLPKILGWIVEPISKYTMNSINISSVTDKEEPITNSKEEPTKVEIVGGKFDSSKIIEYKGEELRNFEFRPVMWEQFIGQEEGKNRAKTIVKKAKRGIRCHFLVDGIKGHGKTTYVELFAKSLNAKLIQRVGKQVDEEELLNIINEINTSTEKYVIFFLDEIETTDWRVIKVLNPIIEQFKIAGKKIKPFIFAGATINKHILISKNPDTLDRIPTHIKFARYNAKEIGKIVTQYCKQLYPTEKISQEVIDTISKNCKFNPRTSISLLEEFIVEQDIEKVLTNSKIVIDGLNQTDIDILRVLNNSTRAMGANSLAMRVKLSQKEYVTEFEPFLVEYGYINRVPSRVITQKGKQLIERSK